MIMSCYIPNIYIYAVFATTAFATTAFAPTVFANSQSYMVYNVHKLGLDLGGVGYMILAGYMG